MSRKKNVITNEVPIPEFTQIEEVPENTINVADSGESEVPPSMGSLDWSSYVMKQFTEEELYDGNPTVDGLRRVAGLLLGELSHSAVDIVNACENFVIARHYIEFRQSDGTLLIFADVADASPNNTDSNYRNYLTAVAATRAEARALRKALRLRKVVSAEELSGAGLPMPERATDVQVGAIKRIAERCSISLDKFLTANGASLDKLKQNEAIKLIDVLNVYQGDLSRIPKELRL